jgi:hypothetical protein
MSVSVSRDLELKAERAGPHIRNFQLKKKPFDGI